MSIIEQAAKRLEQLRQAGIEIPLPRSTSSTAPTVVAAATPISAQATGAPPGPAPASLPRRSRVVHIDLARLAVQGYVTPDAPRTQLANEFRVIKRPLLSNANGGGAAPVRRANLVMITSALAGEGKTFTAVNLALSIAMEMDHTVLLVDADVARPSIPERLGIEKNGKGLLDLLTDESLELADVLLRTNVEKLAILPAGRLHDRATELLASDAMHRLLEDLASRYSDRIVIFDAPPLLASTESRVLATRMGQVVVVVEADNTPQSAVIQAMATLEACPVVMTVLNKVPRGTIGSYYGAYGYQADTAA
ncbi:MAG: XrtA-associated tyrosine autokinase [Sutterellaceae bacterium]|nr:XrtA-associated tyrosine autokinase [Burkholderiaceae bacterium]MDW8429322.1 XrtA-associated tyrosine autokinase [Sutterellaceae bacterium]